MFLALYCRKVIKNLHKHLKDNSTIPREHGNKGRLSPNGFTFDTTKNIVDFITNYATVFGLPQPAARRGCALIYKAITEGDKLTPTQQFKEYVDLAQKEHQYYLDSMKKAEESIKSASETPSYCHYTFGFAKCCKFLTMLDRLDHCISKFL